jgi:uncharacterized lipoprotein YddW (UPF0748 family)
VSDDVPADHEEVRRSLVTFAFLLAASAPAHGEERRALWVVKGTLASAAAIDSAVARAEQIGCADLFVQVRGRGDAMYRSDIVPRADLLRRAGDFDPLAYALDRGHAHGMRVHAWVNTFFLWSTDKLPSSRGHLLLAHPEWLDVDRAGRPMAVMWQGEREQIGAEGAYIAPACVEARRYLVRMFCEIAERYAVDGVHLDYVRYASDEMGYSPYARDAFLNEAGIDPVQLDARAPAYVLAEWRAWRAEQVSALVRDTRAALDSVRAGVVLSAAVFANPEDAYLHRGQDWPRWLREGWIDFAAPMCYGEEWMSVERQIRRSREVAGDGVLYVGLATYNQSASSLAMRAVLARSTGAQGIALFSYDSIAHDSAYWEYLARNVFPARGEADDAITTILPFGDD